MAKKMIRILIISLICLLALSILVEGKNTVCNINGKTDCEGTTCTAVIGQPYITEDEKCKPIQEARSLKGAYEWNIQLDTDYPATVVDYNYTNIVIDIESKILNEDIDLQLKENKNDTSIKAAEKLKQYSKGTTRVSIPLNIYNMTIFDAKIKWGMNSTTIQINGSSGGVLSDLDLYDYVSPTVLLDTHSYIMFNTSIIPLGATINSAVIYLFSTEIMGGWSGDQMTYWNVLGTWDESSNAATIDALEKTNLTTITGKWTSQNSWDYLTVTEQMRQSYIANRGNLSIKLSVSAQMTNPPDTTTNDIGLLCGEYNGGWQPSVRFASENYVADITKRPYLSVTYTSADINQSPSYSNIQTESSPKNYSQAAYYSFNITVQDDTTVDKVLLDWNGTNQTITGSGNVYSTSKPDLAAGTYNYSWYMNDTSGNRNSTGKYGLAIQKVTAILILNSSAGFNISNVSSTRIYGMGCPSQLTCNIYNITGQVIANNTNFSKATVGYYPFWYNTTGNGNFTNSSAANITIQVTEYYPDDTQSPTFSNIKNGSDSWQQYHNFTANFTAADNVNISWVWIESNHTGNKINYSYKLINKASYDYNISLNITLASGNISCWRGYANDTSSNINNTGLNCFTINSTPYVDTQSPTFSNILVESSPKTYNETYTYRFQLRVIDNIAVDDVILDWNGTNQTVTGYSDIYNSSKYGLATGIYNYTWYMNDTVGNRNKTSIYGLAVNQATPNIQVLSSEGYSINNISSTIISQIGCPTQLTCNIYNNTNNIISNGTTFSKAVIGYYPFKVNTTGNSNYTSSTHNITVQVTEYIFINTTGNPSFTIYNDSDELFKVDYNGSTRILTDLTITPTLKTRKGTMTILAQDNAAGEGGQLDLFGATNWGTMSWDNFHNRIRLLGTNGNLLGEFYNTSYNVLYGSLSLTTRPTGTIYMAWDAGYNIGVYSSTETVKKNINPYTVNSSEIASLANCTIEFQWKSDTAQGYSPTDLAKTSVGLSAECVERTDPRFAMYDGQNKLVGVRYMEMVAPLLKESVSQNDKIKSMQEDINLLKQEVCLINKDSKACQ